MSDLPTVRDAVTMDIYVDANGKLWRCVGVIPEPTLIFEEIELVQGRPVEHVYGGISGLMWEGWKRIYRAEPRPLRRTKIIGGIDCWL